MRQTLLFLSIYAFLFQSFLGAAPVGPDDPVVCHSQTTLERSQPAPDPARPDKHAANAACCLADCRLLAIAVPVVPLDGRRMPAVIKPVLPSPDGTGTPKPRSPQHARGPPVLV